MAFSFAAKAQCTDLFFSEYIEGSGSNKAVEIYNPTNGDIDLSNYVLYRLNNGAVTPTDSLFPVGMLMSNDVFVVGNASASEAGIISESDTNHTYTFYNGDDALVLINKTSGDTLDVFGIIGEDPGTGWAVGTGATNEYTLVRNFDVQNGVKLGIQPSGQLILKTQLLS